ncbi:hypothetical protein K501DRAFT_328095 [Backusella circina FSU 941]|nr:hypothetical protein K501DRAFT_328095 [Backusella circina FSU 941]
MTSESALPFIIIHCSSFDEEYEPEQLIQSSLGNQYGDSFGNIKVKGWQTAKNVEYPQDLILQLKSGLCRISNIQLLSHHYKIASQVDVYIGITKEHQDDSMYIEFTRLGFVGLDNSDRFQNRELKSIKVQADCEYIRLVIRGCHDNRLNVYKQVGFVGLNILGYHIDQSNQYNQSLNEISFDSDDQNIDQNHQDNHARIFNDPELELWIDVLSRAEEEAAQDEDYKEAKLYKELGDKLSGYMHLLINLENDKQLAVSTKDYDEADKIKADMIEVKINAESLLKQNGIEITKEGTVVPIAIDDEEVEQEEGALSNVALLTEENESKFVNNQHLRESNAASHPEKLLDEAIANWTSFDALSLNDTRHLTKSDDPNSPSLSAHISIKHPLNKTLHKSEMIIEEEEEEEEEIEEEEYEEEEADDMEVIDPELAPEPLSEEDLESCKVPLEVFDKRIVECIISVKVKCRQHGLTRLSELILSKSNAIKDKREKSSLKYVHASMIMIQSAITDSREVIFNLTLQTWRELCELCKAASIVKNESVFQWTERAFSGLLTRTGDSNPGIKSSASQMVLELVQLYVKSPHDLMPYILGKKDRASRNAKEAKTRLELVTLITEHRLIPLWNKQTTYLDDFMKFVTTCLEKYSTTTDIRQGVISLLVLANQAITTEQMKPYLDQQTLKTLKEKQGKPKSLKQKNGNNTVSELRALAAKTNISSNNKKTKTKAQPTEKTDASKKTKAKKVTQDTSIEEAVTEEITNVCIFCDEENPEFNEDTLISHYYNHCLVLTNCPMCQIILEVSTLRDHLAEDCERKHLVKQCTRCRHPVPVEQWLQHSLKKTCAVTSPDQTRCPYCQKDMTKSTEGDWKSHLMSECTKNPRRKTK